MESILFGTEADMLASHFGNKKPKPNADPTPAEPKKLGETGIGRAVNDKGLTQQRWLQLVQTKFPDAKIVQAKMIDGPSRATLPDGRTLSWTKVDQGVAEGSLEEIDRRGFLQGLGMAAAGAAGLGAATDAQARATPEWTAKVERAKTLMAKGQSREQTARIMGMERRYSQSKKKANPISNPIADPAIVNKPVFNLKRPVVPCISPTTTKKKDL
jgi:hypothetical protein